MSTEIAEFAAAAEELLRLRDMAKSQRENAYEFRAALDAFKRIAEAVTKLPERISVFVDRVETTEAELQAAADQSMTLIQAVPEIVRRIEESDLGRLIGVLNKDIKASLAELAKFRVSEANILREIQRQSETQRERFIKIMSALKHQDDNTALLHGAVNAVQSGLDASASRLSAEIKTLHESQQASVATFSQMLSASAQEQTSLLNSAAQTQREHLQKIQQNYQVIFELMTQLRSVEMASLNAKMDAMSADLLTTHAWQTQQDGALHAMDEKMTEQLNLLQAINKKKGIIW